MFCVCVLVRVFVCERNVFVADLPGLLKAALQSHITNDPLTEKFKKFLISRGKASPAADNWRLFPL